MEITVKSQTWTILSLIDWSSAYLTEKGFESPRLNVELLLAYSLGCQRIQLYTNFDKPLKKEELATFKSYLQRRLNHEPLDYILGESEFMGLRFVVDKSVLIPRPETEVLVEQVIQHCRRESERVFHILDIGTGSGNIAIGLAKFLSNVSVDALDVSEDALTVAQKNVQRHEVGSRINFFHVNILNDPIDLNTPYDVIVSNPPYVSRYEFSTLQPEIRVFEPPIATSDNADGLTFFRRIAEIGHHLLKREGWIFVEIGYNQSDSVTNIFLESGYRDIDLLPDYNGILRVVKARRG